MHEAQLFLQDLALVLSVAAVVTVVFRLLRQPPVLGYLLAGIIVGPNIPIPLVADLDRIRTLAELGVILVMFAIGLEFSVRRLLKLLPTSGLTGAIQLSGMFWLGYGVGQLFGWSAEESLFTGAMIAISSTMIVARTFAEQRVDAKLSEIVFGVLVVQDLAAVVLMAVLTAVASGTGAASDAVVETAAELAAFLAIALTIGFIVVPRATRALVRMNSPETLLVASVGFCFALSLLAHELGYSVALGAFLAGSLIAESGRAEEVERLIAPLRDLFAAVFFIAVGMIVDPRIIADQWGAILALSAAVLIGQTVLVAVGTFLSGSDLRSCVRAGMSLAQIGEFSFIIASIGVAAGAVRDFLHPVAVAVCALTSFATPWMVRLSGRAALVIERRLPAPIQTFTSLFASWREDLRRSASRATIANRIRRLAALLLLDGAILAGVFIGAVVARDRYLPPLAERLSLSPGAALALLWSAALVLALPFVVGLVRVARALGTTLARLVMPGAATGSLDLAAAPRRALVVTMQLAMTLLIGLPFLALTRPFLPFWVGLAALGVTLVALGVSFWVSARNLEQHVRAGAHLVLETLVRQAGDPEPAPTVPLDQVTAVLPGLGHLTAVTLQPRSPAVGRTLIELDLRGLTGASVIAISRAEGAVAAPSGREQLASGDTLTLTGSDDAVAAATALLLDPAPDAMVPA